MEKNSIKICPERSLFLHSDFTEKEADNLIKKLFELNQVKGEIFLQINCTGGSLFGAKNLHENIKLSPNPVIGIVSGKCFSSATLILQACQKRFATHLSQIVVNSLSYRIPIEIRVDAQLEQLMKIVQSELDQLCKDNENLVNAFSEKTTNKNLFMEWLKQEKEMTAFEAKEIGLIDDVI